MISLFGFFYFLYILHVFVSGETIICTGNCDKTSKSIFFSNFELIKTNVEGYIYNRSGHQIYDFLVPFSNCDGKISRYPKNQSIDGGKYVCETVLKNSLCRIYSFGSHNEFSWESEMFRQFKCEIHVFDCFNTSKWSIPSFVTFHDWCIDGKCRGKYFNLTTIMTSLNHSKVDLLKLDVEGHEFSSIQDFKNIPHINLPRQINLEIHTSIHKDEDLKKKVPKMNQVLKLYNELNKLGYSLLAREDNILYPGGTELTLIL
jgi:hypothetical protein